MATVDAVKNTGVDAMKAMLGYASLHSANPGTTGTNELTGGSPAYARKAVTWGASAAGVANMTGTLPTFDVPAGSTVAYVGLWSAASGGTFRGYTQVTSETYGGQGTYAVSAGSFTLTDA